VKAKVQKTASPTIESPTIICIDSLEGGCDTALVADFGAAKLVGLLVLLDSIIRILLEDEMATVGERKE
jgi:hypothetical protein